MGSDRSEQTHNSTGPALNNLTTQWGPCSEREGRLGTRQHIQYDQCVVTVVVFVCVGDLVLIAETFQLSARFGSPKEVYIP